MLAAPPVTMTALSFKPRMRVVLLAMSPRGEMFGHEVSRHAAESWSRMSRSTDVIEPADARLVVTRTRKRAPEQELIHLAATRVRVAPDEIHVDRFEIGGA